MILLPPHVQGDSSCVITWTRPNLYQVVSSPNHACHRLSLFDDAFPSPLMSQAGYLFCIVLFLSVPFFKVGAPSLYQVLLISVFSRDHPFTCEEFVDICSFFNPFRTAVPFWGQTTQFSSSLPPKRDCGSKGVKLFFLPVDTLHTQRPCRFCILQIYELCGS